MLVACFQLDECVPYILYTFNYPNLCLFSLDRIQCGRNILFKWEWVTGKKKTLEKKTLKSKSRFGNINIMYTVKICYYTNGYISMFFFLSLVYNLNNFFLSPFISFIHLHLWYNELITVHFMVRC